MSRLFLSPIAAIGLLTFCACAEPAATVDAPKLLSQGALLVDARSPEEFAERHLANAVNIPFDTVKSDITNHVTDKSKPILLYCRSGHRSGIAEKELRAIGYTNCFNLGGYEQAAQRISPKVPNASQPH